MDRSVTREGQTVKASARYCMRCHAWRALHRFRGEDGQEYATCDRCREIKREKTREARARKRVDLLFDRDPESLKLKAPKRGRAASLPRRLPEETMLVDPAPGAWVDASGRLHGRAKVV